MRRRQPAGRRWALVALTALLLNGCAILAPQRDPSRFYTLAPAAGAARAPSAPDETGTARGSSARVVGIGPVLIPGYLDRHEIATRISATRIAYAPLDLWAEPLSRNMTRVLQSDVAAILGTARVVGWPWLGAVDYQVGVEVVRFEAGTPPGANLDARWTVRAGAGGAVLASGETSVARPVEGTGVSAEVAALSAALSDLAQQIASGVGEAGLSSGTLGGSPSRE